MPFTQGEAWSRRNDRGRSASLSKGTSKGVKKENFIQIIPKEEKVRRNHQWDDLSGKGDRRRKKCIVVFTGEARVYEKMR